MIIYKLLWTLIFTVFVAFVAHEIFNKSCPHGAESQFFFMIFEFVTILNAFPASKTAMKPKKVNSDPAFV